MEEGILKHLHGCSTRPPAPDALAARGESHTITKLKPKIRIVHIVAPEVIQTDAANFRDLVQRLTGKHTRRGADGGGRKRATGAAKVGVDVKPKVPGLCDVTAVMGSLEGYRECPSAEFGEKVKVEVETEGLWMSDNTGAFFGGLAADLDGFMQGLGELPLIPLSASHVDLFGEETPSTSESDRSAGA
ncbi:hypothetical protein Taro_006626 [Colocasia esculenta]|uniref:VQ domain-containing protein n=1 Tax=Colocasia esculenta TaxID=4460 RepID=A0A843TXW3_COLES|nr:hypothetical protein [Colocasia esculenta]